MQNLKNKTASGLRWLEKYTKTDMIYLSKGGFWTTLSQIILSTATLLMAFAWAHFVSKETFGQYKYVLSIMNLLGILTLSGIGTALLNSITSGHEGTLHYAFWQNIKWSALLFFTAFFLAIYYFLQGNNFLGISILVGGSVWPFLTSVNYYGTFLFAKKDFRRNVIYFDLIGNLFPYACLFTAMFLTDNPVWFVIVYFFSNLLIGFILYKRTVSIYKPNEKVDKGLINYSKHLSLISILNGIVDNIDQILVFHYIGAAELAIYNYAIAIPDQIKGPVKNLANLMFPKFGERSDREIKAGMGNKIMLLFFTSVLMTAVYIIAAPYIYRLLLPKYTDAIVYSQIFSLSLVYVIGIPATAYLTIKKKVKEQYISSITISILQIILTFVSIINWGLIGLIIARVIIRILSSLAIIVMYKTSITDSDEIQTT